MMRPHEPHSSRTLETQASFSNSVSPYSSACAFRCGASSQNTHVRLCLERCSRLSRVTPTTRRDTLTSKRGSTDLTRIGGCDGCRKADATNGTTVTLARYIPAGKSSLPARVQESTVTTPGQPVKQGNRSLDPHLRRYAARTAGMTASEIRALFAVASRPEVVSLAGGMPHLAALPLESLSAEIGQLVATEGLVALQYGSAQGVPELREQICDVMALEGINAHPDDVVVTVGSQMALDM